MASIPLNDDCSSSVKKPTNLPGLLLCCGPAGGHWDKLVARLVVFVLSKASSRMLVVVSYLPYGHELGINLLQRIPQNVKRDYRIDAFILTCKERMLHFYEGCMFVFYSISTLQPLVLCLNPLPSLFVSPLP